VSPAIRIFAIILLLTSFPGAHASRGAPPKSAAELNGEDPHLPQKFLPVSPGIYRSDRPGCEGLAAIAKLGIRTDINIDNDPKSAAEEKACAAVLGLEYIAIPLSGFFAPSDRDIDQILALLVEAAKQPVLVHCKYGEDRTGLVIGLHRVFHEDWSPRDAYQEMNDLGFHPTLFFLDAYYRKRTGLVF
jgi:protein tyrosine/serine phosphatase